MDLNDSHDWLNMTDPDHVQDELSQTENDLAEVGMALKSVRVNLSAWTNTAVRLQEQTGHLNFAIGEMQALSREMPLGSPRVTSSECMP